MTSCPWDMCLAGACILRLVDCDRRWSLEPAGFLSCRPTGSYPPAPFLSFGNQISICSPVSTSPCFKVLSEKDRMTLSVWPSVCRAYTVSDLLSVGRQALHVMPCCFCNMCLSGACTWRVAGCDRRFMESGPASFMSCQPFDLSPLEERPFLSCGKVVLVYICRPFSSFPFLSI